MGVNRGKQWEKRFETDWRRSFPKGAVIRLPDQQSGLKGSRNICDYICFDGSHLFLNECKAITGNTFPIGNFTQLNTLLQYADCPGIRAGVVIWYVDHSRVVYVPVACFNQLVLDGLKSVNINKTDFSKYNIVEIPVRKLRVFVEGDYTILSTLGDDYGRCN